MKTNKYTVCIGLVALLFVGVGITLWQLSPNSTSHNSIKISQDSWPGYIHSFVAQETGCFKEEGLDVELTLVEEVEDTINQFKEGKSDALFGLQSDALMLAAEGVPLKIVYIADFSNGADVLIGTQGIKTISDLKGKTVSVDLLNDVNHILLIELLRMNGLAESDVNIIPVPARHVPQALAEGTIDAGQTWEPYQSQAMASGNRVLASTRDVPGMVTDVLMFNSELVEKRLEDVRKFVKCLFHALKFRAANENEAYAIMSKASNVSPGSLKRAIQGNIFPNLDENIRGFEKTGDTTSLFQTGQIISDFFIKKGVIEKPIDLETIHASEIVKSLK